MEERVNLPRVVEDGAIKYTHWRHALPRVKGEPLRLNQQHHEGF